MGIWSFDLLEAALGLVIITDFCLLAAERQRHRIRLLALQGVIMGFMPLLAHTTEGAGVDAHLIAVTAVFLGVKGWLLPTLLKRTHRRLPHAQPVTPYLGPIGCVLAGMIGLVLAIWLSGRLGVSANPLFNVFFPAAFTTIVTGLLLIVTRKLALTQVFGYLTMENGIYLLGVPMVQADAVWLELSVLLDVMVGVFVMGIAIHHLHEEFSSTSVDRISLLKD